MRKIGVMGGTFNPVHLGHLAVAKEAREFKKLDEIIFMPAGQPCFKNLAEIAAASDRLNMLQLAISDQAEYSISRLELERQGPSYAVQSIEQMKSKAAAGAELYFILGWDALLNLPQWYDAERLIKICRIIAAPRPKYPRPDVKLVAKQLPGLVGRCSVMEKPLIDISSTQIRQRIAEGQSIHDLVPASVEEYIQNHNLYRIGQ
jgi:nicotinate-nucleotide adenylyltransferase